MCKLFRVFSVALLAVASSNINASPVIGRWQGNIVVDDNPMFVFLDIESLEPNGRVFQLTWGEPESCLLKATYGGPVDKTEVFYATGSTSSHTSCFKKYARTKSQIRVSITGSGNLHYEILTKGAVRESAVLKRKQK